MIRIALLSIVAMGGVAAVANADEPLDLIPQPASIERGEGFFQIDPDTVIVFNQAARDVAALLWSDLVHDTGVNLSGAMPWRECSNSIGLRLQMPEDGRGVGAYDLHVTRQNVEINAAERAALFHACQTLLQLLPRPGSPSGRTAEELRIPCLTIRDYPRFQWRGLMLDCSRTFQSIEYLEKTIDRMAFYKMNVLHLHLTDDQGWRVEIDRYPELTRTGARFPERWKEPDSHHGFYTKEQIKDLVRHAERHGIAIVPEIEMPGHSLAALACYPELSCTGGPFEIFPFFKGPGINKDILCAGSEETFEFLENVLTEVFALFPSRYIHIGGDEAPKHRWKECARCQRRIEDEGLADEHELQSYFIKRIEKFVNSKGRVIIGWDEILEGGLAPNAAVMSWRGTDGGIAAARAGHDVVMSPTSHCYFDYTYGRIDTRRAYSFEPVPEELTEEEGKHILGLQANFWSHIDREPERVDFQLFPRLLSIAERGWSPRDVRDWEDFDRRVSAHREHLRRMGVQARPMPAGDWKPEQMSEEYTPLEWDVSEAIEGAGTYRILFEYTHGAHRLGILKAALLASGEIVGIDEHRGVTGASHDRNTYTFELARHSPDATYTIRAWVRSEGGLDSSGQLFVTKER